MENATARTGPVRLVTFKWSLRVRVSRSRTLPSVPELASNVPSGEKASPTTSPE
ncbi:hypothetical protein WKI68_39020 [Streptomyces sp. MS1.HAVA.3]|uniref:Uncharacterized protein n=1 Tax=Streptomyces caledonius TaxID=3134107 RepID=A0ABU8UDM1_9ACTN